MTNVLKAFVFKLKPKRAQRSQLAQHAGASRYVYNRMLAQHQAHYEMTGETSPNIPRLSKCLCGEWMQQRPGSRKYTHKCYNSIIPDFSGTVNASFDKEQS